MRVPRGWKLVPKIATSEMMHAGIEAAAKAPAPLNRPAGERGHVQTRAAYNAMLGAAPRYRKRALQPQADAAAGGASKTAQAEER
jgi:hypothetical protein